MAMNNGSAAGRQALVETRKARRGTTCGTSLSPVLITTGSPIVKSEMVMGNDMRATSVRYSDAPIGAESKTAHPASSQAGSFTPGSSLHQLGTGSGTLVMMGM